MSSEPKDRITELEIQLAHVQRLYEQLNEVVTAQSKEIERFERRFHQLQTQLKELKEQHPTVDKKTSNSQVNHITHPDTGEYTNPTDKTTNKLEQNSTSR